MNGREIKEFLTIYGHCGNSEARGVKKIECKQLYPHEAQTTSACSERNRRNLGEVFVSEKSFRNTGCFKKCFRKIVRQFPVCLSI